MSVESLGDARKAGFEVRVLVEGTAPVDEEHLRLIGLRVGLLINFHEEKLVDGVHRIVNGYE